MGVIAGISHNQFPRQSGYIGGRTRVCFNYDTSNVVDGTIVRDDCQAPGETIIKLDDGRYVRATECQYTLPRSAPEAPKATGNETTTGILGEQLSL